MPLELREQLETIEVQRGILLGLWLLLLPLLLAADFLERNHFDFVLVGAGPTILLWGLLRACDEHRGGFWSDSGIDQYLQIINVDEIFNNNLSVIDFVGLFFPASLRLFLGGMPIQDHAPPLLVRFLESVSLQVYEQIAVEDDIVVHVAVVVEV